MHYPVYTTDSKEIGEHMALFLDISTMRPDIKSDLFKYNIRNLTQKEWAKRNNCIQKDGRMRKLDEIGQRAGSQIYPEKVCQLLIGTLKRHFKDVLAKTRTASTENATKLFIKNNQDHEKIEMSKEHLGKGNLGTCSEIQNEISRDNWRKFLEASRVCVLRKIYSYLA